MRPRALAASGVSSDHPPACRRVGRKVRGGNDCGRTDPLRALEPDSPKGECSLGFGGQALGFGGGSLGAIQGLAASSTTPVEGGIRYALGDGESHDPVDRRDRGDGCDRVDEGHLSAVARQFARKEAADGEKGESE